MGRTSPRGGCDLLHFVHSITRRTHRDGTGRVRQPHQRCGARHRWLADMNDFTAFNEVYATHFAGALPSCSTVQAQLYKGALIEIEVQAWVG